MSQTELKLIAVNNPGGQPRQFCVQKRDDRSLVWKRSAVFHTREMAQQCSEDLQQAGWETRVVHYRLPTAA